MKTLAIIRGKGPKLRKPVAKKCNSIMKSKKTYTRKAKHKGRLDG